MADVALWLIALLGLAFTALAAVESVRAGAWGWLASILLLWPVGLLAWFVAGRRFYVEGERR